MRVTTRRWERCHRHDRLTDWPPTLIYYCFAPSGPRCARRAVTNAYKHEQDLLFLNGDSHMSEMSVASINERAAEEYFKRGNETEKEGNHEKAIEFYERALNENPDHEQACFSLAVMYDRRAD